MQAAAIVLAAGAGTRMKSKKPKVAHEVLGKPLVKWVIDQALAVPVARVVTVVGYGREQVVPLVEGVADIVVQPERKGTADAVAVCREALADFDGSLLVLSGDCPLIKAQTIVRLIEERERAQAACALLTMEPDDPFGYGRIVRDGNGEPASIVEQKDATLDQALIRECNAGFYCFDTRWLFDALGRIDNDNVQGEFYLTDTIALARAQGRAVRAIASDDSLECLGVNSRAQLAQAVKAAQRRINRAHLDAGVTMTDPDQVWIGPDVKIAQDVELLPQVFLMGATSVGEDSVIGPNSRLADTQVGRGCRVDETVADKAVLEDGAEAGPRAYLRPGAHLCAGSKAGTHVEIKKSTIGPGSKVPHLSYVGDATIGANVNVGAGSITCNYDGKGKHATSIGDGAFIGSDTMLVAPVSVGAGAIIGAGSCITRDVPADALGMTRPEQTVVEGWAAKKRARLGIG